MAKRNTQQRRRLIIEKLNRQGEVKVDQLAQQFNTSEVTIRKDLTELEESGLLLRRYGGAIPLPSELLLDANEPEVSIRKKSIAKTAARLIKDHHRIILDSGSTTAALLPELSDKQGLVVMTNSLNIAGALRELENEPVLLMTGGTWDPHSEAFQGKVAEEVLKSYDFDQLFIGADGLDVERGTTTFNELFGLSQVMAQVSRDVVVMAESNKIGRKMHNVELPWQQIRILVTDHKIADADRQAIEAHGVQVIVANEL
ncbi:DeoR/GlpR family DNA-binding transcription regulator [Celerinatantimonas yamalensis]|uniref:DeoR family transcriptional regulator n=1 Tax=Celerinatantimonas yamalensis TaxID=559956 RepID=A0ABW9G899_9GAMM